MKMFDRVLVMSHVAYRKESPFSPIEGPYSALSPALSKIVKGIDFLGLPLNGYQNEVVYGEWNKTRKTFIPGFLGKWLPIKFVVDTFLNTVMVTGWSLANWGKKKLVIGIDPLSCLPLWPLKKLLGYTLVFHCVDFNRNRFGNRLLQRGYELADEFASRLSDQTWVICESLRMQKLNEYGIKSFYVPNSVVFEPSIYENGKSKRTGDKMIWTGALMTARQYDILFRTLSDIQTRVRPDLKFLIAPTRDHNKFERCIKKYQLKKTKLLKLTSRLEFQKIASRCDAGIALYDEQFGSTEFIEPMKIWDFLLCGLPFIVSSEPSLSKIVKESGVAYVLQPKNVMPDSKSCKSFLSKGNLKDKAPICTDIAKKFDIEIQLKKRLRVLLSKKQHTR